MALSQEFWLQQRRREATGPPMAAGGAQYPGNFGNIPAAFAGGAARVPGSLPPPPPPPAQPQMPMAAAAMQMWQGMTGGVMPISAGVPWSVPAVRRPVAPEPPTRFHKQWNSDDEEIDEFGRKKRKQKPSTKSSGSSAAAQEADGQAEQGKSKKQALSDRHKAALERLKSRAKPKEQPAPPPSIEKEKAPPPSAPAGDGEAASPSAPPEAGNLDLQALAEATAAMPGMAEMMASFDQMAAAAAASVGWSTEQWKTEYNKQMEMGWAQAATAGWPMENMPGMTEGNTAGTGTETAGSSAAASTAEGTGEAGAAATEAEAQAAAEPAEDREGQAEAAETAAEGSGSGEQAVCNGVDASSGASPAASDAAEG